MITHVFILSVNFKEMYVYNLTCLGFQCANERCLELDKVCDGLRDCKDAADENPILCNMTLKRCSNKDRCSKYLAFVAFTCF